MSGGGKSSQDVSETEIDPDLKKAALENLDTAKEVAKLPYSPNMGVQVADFSPTQKAAFSNTGRAASAFGLTPSAGTGLPAAQQSGGFSGFSTNGLYNDTVNASMSPAVQAAYMGALDLPKEVAAAAPAASKEWSLGDLLVQNQKRHMQPAQQQQSVGGGK